MQNLTSKAARATEINIGSDFLHYTSIILPTFRNRSSSNDMHAFLWADRVLNLNVLQWAY